MTQTNWNKVIIMGLIFVIGINILLAYRDHQMFNYYDNMEFYN